MTVSTGVPISTALAGTSSDASAETARLREEVTAARNALDSEVLKPGAKPDSPSVTEKSAALREKLDAYTRAFEKSQKAKPAENRRSALRPSEIDPNDRGENVPPVKKENGASTPRSISPQSIPPPHPSTSESREPETVLSGKGIPKEIRYKGKTEKTDRKDAPPSEESEEDPVPDPSGSPNASGLSEIHYGK